MKEDYRGIKLEQNSGFLRKVKEIDYGFGVGCWGWSPTQSAQNVE